MISNELTAPVYMAGSIALLLLVSAILRATVKPLKKMMLSAGIIAGLIGFIIMSFNVKFNFMPITPANFEALSLHVVCLNFMALIYLGIGQDKKQAKEEKSKRGGLFLALLIGGIISLQAVIGGVVGMIAGKTVNPDFDTLCGTIAANGFGGSPSAALTAANLWKDVTNENIVAFGIFYSSIGFLMASLVGVPIVKHFIKKDMTTLKGAGTHEAFTDGYYKQDKTESYGNQVMHRSNIDQLVFQLAFLIGTYAVIYLSITTFINKFVDNEKSANTLYNIMFIFCIFGAVIFRILVDALHLGRFFDRGVQTGIAGLFTDTLLVSCMMAVSISVVLKYIVPLIANTILIVGATAIVIWFLVKDTGKGAAERFLYSFGATTGTAASGQVLVKIIDPGFTTVGNEIVWSNVFCAVTSLTTWLAAFVPFMTHSVYIGINIVGCVIILVLAYLMSRKMAKDNNR